MKEIRKTMNHNISVIVGNGFDISILNKYSVNGITTSYSKFYDYLVYKNFNPNNQLFLYVKHSKEMGRENWCDFETALQRLSINLHLSLETLNQGLEEMQFYFLQFLNDVVTPELLIKLNKDAISNQWANNSLSKFMYDLNYDNLSRISFPFKTKHYDCLNFNFFDLNYTFLLDNYIYLDKNQFDPHPYRTSESNFGFYPYPCNIQKHGINSETMWSCKLNTNVYHVHGIQSVPRSLLFGYEAEINNKSKTNPFIKSYWAQDDLKYKPFIDKSELFIIFGSSLSETDSWWWKNIANSLLNKEDPSELIIYFFNKDNSYSKDNIKDMFITASIS